MSGEPATTEQMRFLVAWDARDDRPDPGMEEEFDRWLNTERARAWTEGAQHVASGRLHTDNPYERP